MQSIIKANYSLYLGFSRPANWRGLPREKQAWSLSQRTFTTLFKSKTTPRSDLHTQTQHIYNMGNLANCLSYVCSRSCDCYKQVAMQFSEPRCLLGLSISLWMQYMFLRVLGLSFKPTVLFNHMYLFLSECIFLQVLCLSLKPTVLFNHIIMCLFLSECSTTVLFNYACLFLSECSTTVLFNYACLFLSECSTTAL